MKKTVSTLFSIVLAGMLALSGIAVRADEMVTSFGLAVHETSGRDQVEGKDTILLSGHEIELTILDILPESAQASFSIKASKKAVTAVDLQAFTVRGLKAGSSSITVSAKPGKASCGFRVKVIANRSPTRKFPVNSAPAPHEGGGIIPMARCVYEKNGNLLMDLYIYNANIQAVKGIVPMKIFFQEQATADMQSYMDLGDWNVNVKRTAPGKYSVSKINLGSLDELQLYADTVVLLNSMAFGQTILPDSKSIRHEPDTQQLLMAMLGA